MAGVAADEAGTAAEDLAFDFDMAGPASVKRLSADCQTQKALVRTEWFRENMWPRLQQKRPNAQILPIGRDPVLVRAVSSSPTKTKTPAEVRARRAEQARPRRLEDKLDVERARKALADIDSGNSKVLTWEEFKREVDSWH